MKTDLNVISPVLVFLFIGHFIGDFYLQSDELVEKKKTNLRYLFFHGSIYAICIITAVFISTLFSVNSILLCISLSIIHLAIDLIKNILLKLYSKNISDSQKQKSFRTTMFFVDQAVHIFSIVLCYQILSSEIKVKNFLEQKADGDLNNTLILLLGLLVILRPVDIIISKLVFDSTSSDKTGKIIGYLERIIIYILLQFGAFSSIAFVLTAKSVARFKEIEQDEARAKYYLIGTLTSTCAVLIVSFTLGLCGQS